MSSTCSDSSSEIVSSADERYRQYGRHAKFIYYALLHPLLQRSFSKRDSQRESGSVRGVPQCISHASSRNIGEIQGSITPPSSYAMTENEFHNFEVQPAVRAWVETTAAPSRSASTPSSCGSTTPTYVGDHSPQELLQESGSGIRWRYADPGFASLKLAQFEEGRSSMSSLIIRRQYISGVACLLHGLPTELGSEEIRDLHEALPTPLSERQHIEPQLAKHLNITSGQAYVQPPRRHSSILQEWVAMGTMYMFLAVAFILPHVRTLLQEAYEFDRRHKISDKILSHSMHTAEAVRRTIITIAAQVCSMNDGKVGEQLKDASIYMVKSLSGGVYDGIGEGMQVLGLRMSNDR